MAGITGIELGQQLKELMPNVNIIFVTGYSEYTGEAMDMHASGYIMKPVTAEKVAQELEDLRYPVNDSNNVTLSIKCFGNFEVYLPDGDILRFERAKAKEVFAYLVYRQGASSTIKEIAARIFENEEYDLRHQMYLQKIISSMMKTLKQINAEHIIIKAYNSISVNTEFIDCDYYHAVNQEPHALNTYTGEFMAQYSWAEYMNGYLYRLASGKK
jgi:two-component SAPR family response regulator